MWNLLEMGQLTLGVEKKEEIEGIQGWILA